MHIIKYWAFYHGKDLFDEEGRRKRKMKTGRIGECVGGSINGGSAKGAVGGGEGRRGRSCVGKGSRDEAMAAQGDRAS